MSVGGIQIPTGQVLEKAQKLAQETPQQLQEFEKVLQSLEQQGGDASSIAAKASEHNPAKVETASETGGLYEQKLEEAGEPGGVEKLMSEVETGYQQLNGLLDQLKGGRTFKAQELLALQAQVHQVSLQVETTTKVISEVVSNVKQLMQQQI